MPAVLDELVGQPTLVDRVVGVVSLGVRWPRPRSLAFQFQHAALEPEIQRTVLFVSFADIDVDAP